MKEKELNLGSFKYFLECYFNVSANYDELKKNVRDFKDNENIESYRKLKEELKYILELGDWGAIQEFIKKYGMRRMNEDKIKWLIKTILNTLDY